MQNEFVCLVGCTHDHDLIRTSIIDNGGSLINENESLMATVVFYSNQLSDQQKVLLEMLSIGDVPTHNIDDYWFVLLDMCNRKSLDVKQRDEITEREDCTFTLPAADDEVPPEDLLAVDRYAPKEIKDLVGNSRIIQEVRNWFILWNSKAKDRPARFKRAIMLCGRPGMGKTSMAHILARNSGFKIVECNASDVRNKDAVNELLRDTARQYTLNLDGYVQQKPACIIMDEVDGMSAGDRGGSSALAEVIRNTKTPIICICNDKYANAVKTLKNLCTVYDLIPPTLSECFPRVKQISQWDNANLSDQEIRKIISDCQGDMRQIITMVHMVGLVKSGNKDKFIEDSKAHVGRGLFDATKMLFAKSTSVGERSELHWTDSSMMALFVQENYHQAVSCGDLEKMALAAESFSQSDQVDALIHAEQAWHLSSVYAYLATVIPCTLLAGRFRGRVEFPTVLGKYSKIRKLQREGSALMHKCKMSEDLDSLVTTAHLLIKPLMGDKGKNNVEMVAQSMYDKKILREDLDSLAEITAFGEDPMKAIKPQVKSALTRQLKKIEEESLMKPFDEVTQVIPKWF